MLQVTKQLPEAFYQGIILLIKMAKEIQDVFTAQKVDLQTEINIPLGGMIIYNTGMANVKLGHNLSELLGIGSNLMFMTFVKR